MIPLLLLWLKQKQMIARGWCYFQFFPCYFLLVIKFISIRHSFQFQIILAFHLQNDPCYSTSQSSFNFTTLVTKHFCLRILFFIQSRVKNSTETIFIAWMSYTWRNPIFHTAQQQKSQLLECLEKKKLGFEKYDGS